MSGPHTKLESLAIHGGAPVREKLLPYGRQSLDDEDIQAVVEVLKSDWLTTGPKVDEFEEQFAAWIGARYAISFSSGTAALHGAAFAATLGPGDEAITTPLTFCATANCILYQGATPVFADVSPDTLNLDPQEVFEKLTGRTSSRTKAIIAVDYAGHPAALDELGQLAKTHGVLLIEDACHALGAEFQGKRVGSIADMTVFSFHPVKHLTTGEGGMVATNDARLAETLRRFRNHGISSEARQRQEAGQWFYEMVLLGFNYRLTDIACRFGTVTVGKTGSEPGTPAGNCGSVRRGIPGFAGYRHSYGARRRGSGVAPVPGPAAAGITCGGARRDISSGACGEYRRECSLYPGPSASVLPRALRYRGRLSSCGGRV